MALDSQSKIRLGWIAAAAAPLVAVHAARLLGGGPAHAAAATQIPESGAVPAAATLPAASPLSPEQIRAIEWLAARRSAREILRSPIDETAPPVKAVQKAAAPEADPLPKLRLGGIASRGKDVVASINNRLFAVGDEPAENWTITAIDAHTRAVALRRVDGARAELTSAGIFEQTGKE